MMFDNMFRHYLNEFCSIGEPYLKTLANCAVPSRIVRMKYKELPPIESLPVDKKNELWEYANECYPDETTVFKTNFCQIVYTVGTLL
jgi:hypothetical protein